METEMRSAPESEDENMSVQDSDDDNDDPDYYSQTDDFGDENIFDKDPEYFEYQCLTLEEVERLLNEHVAELSQELKISPSLAKMLLHAHRWTKDTVVTSYRANKEKLLIETGITPAFPPRPELLGASLVCQVCMIPVHLDKIRKLSCGHMFCIDCWDQHFEVQITQGVSSTVQCMARECQILAPEDFILDILSKPELREKYQKFAFRDHVDSHPHLRCCPGPNCQMIAHAKPARAKRAQCKQCGTSYCFKCGNDYHAPTDCDTIKRWLTKCADDSETANYISAHTKDCPKCNICIEKNGGCNHMQCWKCKHDFCWMCAGDWKTHGSEYYECSRYKENPNIANESAHAKAREALKKYLFYFERWENHAKSLNLESDIKATIRKKIEEKVMASDGTWIDWQYLVDVVNVLTKCRYTLQYTYPYAYYMEPGPRKNLFEYQQAQLEAEIESLSWKVERAESHDRGDIENQTDVTERRRVTLLKDFNEGFNAQPLSGAYPFLAAAAPPQPSTAASLASPQPSTSRHLI